MGRLGFNEEQKEQGRALVDVLKRERGDLPVEDLAQDADIRIDTIRRIERYETFNPGFFTVAQLVDALDLDLNLLRDLVEKQLTTRKRQRRRTSKRGNGA